MNLLSRIWSREGPGVPKHEAPKTGLALLGATIRREAGDLLGLNLMIVVASLPLITLPAALAAGAHVAIEMLEDRPIYLWRQYWRAFADCFVRATGYGLALMFLITGALWTTWIYGQLASHHLVFVPLLVIGACVALALTVLALHVILRIAEEKRGRPGLLRRAALGALTRPLATLVGLGAAALLWGSVLVFYPVTVLLAATYLFSFSILVVTFAARPGGIPRVVKDHSSTLEETK
ncbi:DUF624 domain-containing protein [Pelagibacterium halotolerans]|uniref:DUF624 domain-containing protein n=1 Tax=Pelagibacterium halotolerans TaxID=531813 RepID=UPI00384EF035